MQKNLPHIFNRQFKAQSIIANRIKVDEGNIAGVQKKAVQHFMELVRQEQSLYKIPPSQAYSRVQNREETLTALANFTISPSEAFSREPGLREKLLPEHRQPRK